MLLSPKEMYSLKIHNAFELLCTCFPCVEIKRESFQQFKIKLHADDGSVVVYTGKSADAAIERAARNYTTIFDK